MAYRGSSPASTTAPQASRISARDVFEARRIRLTVTIRARRGDGPTRRTTSSASGGRSGTRTPIVSGRVPVSQRNRRAGFGRISVYGPGSSARAATAAAAASLGHRVENRVEIGGEQLDGHRLRPLLGRAEPPAGSLPVRIRAEPVDRVGRKDDQLSGPEGGDGFVAHARRPPAAICRPLGSWKDSVTARTGPEQLATLPLDGAVATRRGPGVH